MRFIWPDSARAELRAIGRDDALRILYALTAYAETGRGDIKSLQGEWLGFFRLRIGEYRVIFSVLAEEITISRVGHRSEVYR